MSTDFTTVLAADLRPLPELVSAIKTALADTLGMRGGHPILRCELQSDTNTFDEVVPEQALPSLNDVSEQAKILSSWKGFSTEFWNDKMQLYVMVGDVDAAPKPIVNVWVTLSTRNLERLVTDGEVNAYCAALAELARVVKATAGYGHFELAYEPVASQQAEAAILDLPDYPGEPATVGVLPWAGKSIQDLERNFTETFAVVRSTAGYAILVNRKLDRWLGGG